MTNTENPTVESVSWILNNGKDPFDVPVLASAPVVTTTVDWPVNKFPSPARIAAIAAASIAMKAEGKNVSCYNVSRLRNLKDNTRIGIEVVAFLEADE